MKYLKCFYLLLLVLAINVHPIELSFASTIDKPYSIVDFNSDITSYHELIFELQSFRIPNTPQFKAYHFINYIAKDLDYRDMQISDSIKIYSFINESLSDERRKLLYIFIKSNTRSGKRNHNDLYENIKTVLQFNPAIVKSYRKLNLSQQNKGYDTGNSPVEVKTCSDDDRALGNSFHLKYELIMETSPESVVNTKNLRYQNSTINDSVAFSDNLYTLEVYNGNLDSGDNKIAEMDIRYKECKKKSAEKLLDLEKDLGIFVSLINEHNLFNDKGKVTEWVGKFRRYKDIYPSLTEMVDVLQKTLILFDYYILSDGPPIADGSFVCSQDMLLRQLKYKEKYLQVAWHTEETFRELILDFVRMGQRSNGSKESVTSKPVIYLYPEEKTDINVKLDYNGRLTHTYPKYNKSWDVTAEPDGTIYYPKTGREYYCLFWEGVDNFDYQINKGFVIEGKNTIAFLEEKLKLLGLTDKEANEFIIFWLPKMENNKYNLIYFAEEDYTDNAALDINPPPETLIRVMMVFKALDEPLEIPQQVLKRKTRKGYTVVEWGGREIR